MKDSSGHYEFAFTPGDWKRKKQYVLLPTRKNGEAYEIIQMAKIPQHERVANAQLIATAPRVLMALIELKNWVEHLHNQRPDASHRKYIKHAEDIINEAIGV